MRAPIITAALYLFDGAGDVEELTSSYFSIRIWGAPAGLAIFTILGTLVGLGRSRLLLRVQLFMNRLNIGLDLLFAGVLGWGIQGRALGTVLAEWLSLVLVARLVLAELRQELPRGEFFWPGARIFDLAKLGRMLSASGDIMLRTLIMLFCFAWFTNQGARFGATALAANHILVQLITFSTYFLGGFSHAAEPLVGRAIGGRDRVRFDQAVRNSTELAALAALLLSMILVLSGDLLIRGITDIDHIRSVAVTYLPFAALYVLLSCGAVQLDGIFTGASWTRAMRQAAGLSGLVFLALAWPLSQAYSNLGLWLAFVAYVLAGALALAMFFPGLRGRIPRAG